MKSLPLPLLALLALFASASRLFAADSEPFAKEIAAYQAKDATNPPPANSIMFVGSSSMVKWQTLTEDFPGLPVVNRGYGGSLLADMPASAARLVVPYHPAIVVIYAGDNDLAAKKSVEEVAATFKSYRAQLEAALPQVKIVFIAIKPSVARRAIMDKIKATNDLIAKECASDPRCTFVDVYTPMLDAKGEPRPELLVADGLHMSPDGYRIWTKLLNPVLHRLTGK